MGIVKYEQLGMEYPLKGVKALSAEEAKHARDIIISAMKEERNKQKSS
jgi:pyruvate formate lyase activating enzyme